MVHSKNKALGFWLCLIALLIYIFGAVCCTTQFYFDYKIIKIDISSQRGYNGFMIIIGIACIIFGGILYFRASLITIDCEDKDLKTISFKNLFSRQKRTYNFTELDGFIKTKLLHKQFSENNTLFLIKEGKVAKVIDNFFYSNVDELENALKDLPYLGFKPMNFANYWRFFFGQRIIKE